jgi:organic radical activating enzyme
VPETLVVNEIYLSLQGESTFAGLPCVFIRLTACDLRCSYCDTAYAFTEGKKQTFAKIMTEVRRLAKPFSGGTSSESPKNQGLVELTPPKLFQRHISRKITIASAMRYQPNRLNVCVWT